MSIVLRENEWAEQAIQSKTLGVKPSETFRRVARYYLDEGYSKSDVRKNLDVFLLQCDSSASLPKWSPILDYALNRACKCKAINIDYITVTEPEIAKVNAVEGKQTKRLAFALVCLAKYWDAVNPNGDHWVNSKDNEIMTMANIKTSIRRQGLMYWQLKDDGLIQFSRKVDNTNVRVVFLQEGNPVVKVSDFRNLGYQYLKYCGEPYFECANCGMTVRYNDPNNRRRQKYCKSCATEIAIQQRTNYAMRGSRRENEASKLKEVS